MKSARRCWVPVIAVGLVGCGSNDPETPTRPGEPIGEGCDAIELAPPPAGLGFQVSLDMHIEPGAERQVCKLVLAGEKVNLNYSEGLFNHGSHHALVFRTSYRDALPTQNVRGETVDPSE